MKKQRECSILVHLIAEKTRRHRLWCFSGLMCWFFARVYASTVFFSFFSENLDKWWMNGHPVILRGCQICVLIAFHAIFRPTLDYRCCAISSRELSAIFYDPLRKKIPSWYETSVWWYCLKWARNVQRRWKVCANHTQLWYWRDFTELATCLMISLLCSIKQRK